MKWHACLLAVSSVVLFTSCGSNSSDKETTTNTDTVAQTIDTAAMRRTIDSANAAILASIPENIKTGFAKKYPNASNVKWEYHQPAKEGIDWELSGWQDMDEQDYHAWFHWQGEDHQSHYTKKGDWVGTTNTISDPAKLPAPVTSSIKKNYDGYTVTSITKENDKDRTAYEVKLEKNDTKMKLLIDESGNVIKSKTIH